MPESPVVFLLTDTDVLVQEEGTKLWRSVSLADGAVAPKLEGSEVRSDAGAQLRALRRDKARRVHPAGSAHRIADRSADGPRLEIYNPLTSTWATIPSVGQRAQVGDALCARLPDGRVLISAAGRAASGPCATYDPATGQWSTVAGTGSPGARRRGSTALSVIAVRRSEEW